VTHLKSTPPGPTSELERCREALRVTTEALNRANADLEQFAWAAAHEFQEPLRMVTVFNQMLEDRYSGRLDPQADEFLRYSAEGASRLRTLVRDLVEYTHAAGACEGNPEVTEVSAVLSLAISSLKETIQQNEASVKTGLMPRLRTQAEPLQRVFHHLIGNSLKFRDEKPPEVVVSALARKSDWLFSVADNGIGIDPQYFHQIFGLFKRLHPASDYPGSGVGLAVCKRIVERLNGKVWVESAPGQGATFFFTLPRGL
jgi:light-regulated signal transduction histidine kinase (bacteriophytochrome)